MAERILVVEDSATQAEALRGLLEEAGYAVTVATSGESALDVYDGDAFDLVMSDIMMPGMNGFELCGRIKASANPTAVILLTSLSDPKDIVRGLQARADNYVTKPYRKEALLSRVERVLQGRKQPAPDHLTRVRFLDEEFAIPDDSANSLTFMLSIFEELLHTNRELETSRREQAELARIAERASQARDDVLAVVSHDLLSPLGTILASVELLVEMPFTEEQRLHQYEMMQRSGERMVRLIRDLLDVAQLEGGTLSLNLSWLEAEGLLKEAVLQLQSVAAARGITLNAVVRGDPAGVCADRDRLMQVFANLVGNAARLSPEGSEIKISLDQNDDRVTFSVTDQGPGIGPADLPHLFDRFWQGERKMRGSAGLGLAIVKGIVEAHGGTILVTCPPGEGACFQFSLPTAAARAVVAPEDACEPVSSPDRN